MDRQLGSSRPALRSARLVALLALNLSLGAGAPVSAGAPLPPVSEPGLRAALDVMPTLTVREGRVSRPGRRPARPIGYGRDGRFTILLLGSDWRAGSGGERLDVVMVMSIDPRTGQAAAATIPRDMVAIPRARANGGGDSGSVRVNAMYYFYRDPELPHEAVDRRALSRFTADIARLLGTQIDAWAIVRFAGFSGIVNLLGGISVDVRATITDPSYRSGSTFGVYFPKEAGYRLRGDAECRPYPRKCRSALIYARSRKGSVGSAANGDFRRNERQMELVLAGVRQVVQRHGAGLALITLMTRVRRHVVTSLPATPASAAQLYMLLRDVRLPLSAMKVLGPSTWASSDSSTPLYTYRPRLKVIRRWVNQAFAPVRGRD